MSVKLEREDRNAEADCVISTPSSSDMSAVGTAGPPSYPSTANGLKGYWRDKNCTSIDGLPGVTSGFQAPQQFFPDAIKAVTGEVQSKDIERIEPGSSVHVSSWKRVLSRLMPGWEQEKQGIIVGFLWGALAMVVAQRTMSVLAGILIT